MKWQKFRISLHWRWRILEDWKIKVAALWLIYTGAGLGSGLFMLWEPGAIEQIIAGELAGAKITPEIMVINAISLLLPLVMAFLSLTLKDSINRWANIVVGIFSIGFLIISLAAESAAAYAILLSLSMVVAAALIVWYAWKSKQKT